MEPPRNSIGDVPRTARIARALASPLGVLILLPLLVIGAGIIVLLLGRRATRDASDSMARRQLSSQAADVQHEVAFALDQADPMLARLRALADPTLSIAEVGPRMHDLMIGRPGVANVSIGFPSGLMRGTFVPDGAPGEIQINESIIEGDHTTRTNYQVVPGGVRAVASKTTDYDVRKRPHYTLAVQTRARAWTPPRVYFSSKTTGITCVEPIYAADGTLQAVTTVDFDVGALSQFIVRAPLEGSRAVVFAGDGTILAYPSAPVPEVATKEARLLRHDDYQDPALEALFARAGTASVRDQRFFELASSDGEYLASVAPLGGERAGIKAPLDWYLAALVPERTLLGPTKRLEKQSLLASGGALVMALGVALMFAWNLVRMRRAVSTARERARKAEAKIVEMGAYRLVSRLGVGGMGEVWRAEHRLLARQAAVKLVRPDALVDPLHRAKAKERFRREAQTLASMRSRHTIALFDYGVADDGTFFYVMELLDGLDLDRLVREFGAQPPARVIQILIHACQSLAEAHDAGLLHRDIKPANIYLSRAADEVDIAKVLDFGIVHTIADPIPDPIDVVSLPAPKAAEILLPPTSKLTQAGAVVGTPGYIPPEQVTGTGADARSDLYALGCVAWWLLSSSEVYARPDEESAIRSHIHDPVPELRPRVKGWLPVALEALVIQLLAKNPDDRPADARELATRLRQITIPDEHAWTEQRAQAWWFAHRPRPMITAESSPLSVERLLVPQNSDQITAAPVAAPEAATMPAIPRSQRR
ncbi:MAG: protein kinase [Myxococcales bacterium]|nr:protein kinase [Myxococcales bacterium]